MQESREAVTTFFHDCTSPPQLPRFLCFRGGRGGRGLEVQASLSAFQKIGWEKEGVGVRLGVSGGKNGVWDSCACVFPQMGCERVKAEEEGKNVKGGNGSSSPLFLPDDLLFESA